MSYLSVLLICLCIGVEAFWTGFYIKCRKLSFSKPTIIIAFLGSLIVCIPFLYFGQWLGAHTHIKGEIAGLIFGILGTLSITQNIKRKEDESLRWNLKYYLKANETSCCLKCTQAFYTGIVSSFSALIACMALGLLSISSPFICVFISATLVLSLVWGAWASNKTALNMMNSVLKYLPGCILLFIGLLKFF